MRVKKLLFVILLFFLLLPSTCVRAESTTMDGIAYRWVSPLGFDEEVQGYGYQYRVYTNGGLKEGSVYIPASIYDKKFWYMWVDDDNIVHIESNPKNYTGDSYTYNFMIHNSSGVYDYSFTPPDKRNWTYSTYNKDTGQWTTKTEYYGSYYTNNSIKFGSGFSPNSILYVKNCNIQFNGIDYGNLIDWRELKCPELKYRPSSLFRLYLNDFSPGSVEKPTSSNNSLAHTYINSLYHLNLHVYDIDNSEVKTQELDMLTVRDIEQDSEGRYYIDINVVDIPYIHDSTGNYLVIATTWLKTIYSYPMMIGLDSKYENALKSQITTIDYWRYTYNADTGIGMLVPADENGNPLDPETPEPEKPSQEVLELQEQTKVSKSILQTIIDLPKTLIDMFLELLKSLFIPSEGFFNAWLDDLNTHFGDCFGILYYPFELLIDFLNRIGSIAETDTAIISIPAFSLDFFGNHYQVFDAYSYDLNSLLVNDTFKNIHTIYLTVVDIILWLGVVYLAARCLQSVLGGMADTSIPDYTDTEEYADSQAYKSYTRNKKFGLNDKQNLARNATKDNYKRNKIGF